MRQTQISYLPEHKCVPRGINILDIRKALQTPEHSTEQQQSSLLVCSEFIINHRNYHYFTGVIIIKNMDHVGKLGHPLQVLH